ncbi:MAG: hypothetical protein ACLR0U_17855 [Enterocloster clostridioformis]
MTMKIVLYAVNQKIESEKTPGLEKDNSGITANDERWSTRPGCSTFVV